MKSHLSVLVTGVLILFGSITGAQACLDFSGQYSTGVLNPVTGASVVFNLVQTGCSSIAVGSYYLNADGEKTNEVQPVVTYVTEGNESACQLNHCRIFRFNGQNLEFDENSTIDIGGLNCRYDKVQWSLNQVGIVQTYFVSDSAPRCKQHQTLVKVLPRAK
jgi:hypothetical protein